MGGGGGPTRTTSLTHQLLLMYHLAHENDRYEPRSDRPLVSRALG